MISSQVFKISFKIIFREQKCDKMEVKIKQEIFQPFKIYWDLFTNLWIITGNDDINRENLNVGSDMNRNKTN